MADVLVALGELGVSALDLERPLFGGPGGLLALRCLLQPLASAFATLPALAFPVRSSSSPESASVEVWAIGGSARWTRGDQVQGGGVAGHPPFVARTLDEEARL